MSTSQKLAVILFADIEGYTAMMQQDQEAALQLLNRFKLVLEAETAQNQGTVIQYFGDGALLTFESAASAVTCAMAMQSAYQAEPLVPVRMGIHLGDVVFKEGNIFGDGVNVASRIESLSVPGAVLMSKPIRDQLKNKAGFQTSSLGNFEFKNVVEPVEVFALANEGFVVPKRGQMKGKLKDKKQHPFTNTWVLATVIALLVALAWNFWPSSSPENHQKSASVNQAQKSIAVLPFRNLSNDSSQIYFSDGMAEEVLNALTQLKDLKVSARTSSFKFRGDEVDLAEVGEKLGVNTVLEGSVRKSGNRVRITASLINISDESQMWSKRFDRELQDVFAIHDEIAQAIVRELELTFAGGEGKKMVKVLTENKEAYDLYLKGKNFAQMGRFQKAIELIEEAVRFDPGFAEAYAWLSISKFRIMHPTGRLLQKHEANEIRTLAEKAFELDSNSAEAIDALIYVYHDFDYDYQKARKLLERAIKSNPTSGLYMHLAFNVLRRGGSIDSVFMNSSKIKELDPLSIFPYHQLTLLYFFCRKPNELASISKELETLFPSGLYQANALQHIDMAKGNYTSAAQRMEPFLSGIEINKLTLEYVVHLNASARVYPQKTRQKLAEFKANSAWGASPTAFALIHLALGDTSEVYRYLDEAIVAKDFTFLSYLRFSPKWDELRGEPRFQSFLKRLDGHLPPFDGRGWGIPYLEAAK